MTAMQKGLPISKKVWAAGVTLLSAAILSAASPAFAGERQDMTYDVYAGGFHVLQSKLRVDTAPKNRYDLMLDSHTFGFLGKLVKWKGTFETQGWQTVNGFRPEVHESISNNGGDAEIKTYQYNKDGSFKSYRVKGEYDEKQELRPVEKELTHQTTDALSATLSVMDKIAQGGKCEGDDEVFDGKRRYRLVYKDQGTEELVSSKYNIYGGIANKCTVEVKPVAGKWDEKPRGWMSIQEQGREAGTMPTVWFAKMAEGAPAVPVKIKVRTDYGVLFMHLTGYQGKDKTLKLAAQ